MRSYFKKPVYCIFAASLMLVSQLAVAGGNTGNKDGNLTALGKAPNWYLVVDNTTHQVTFESAEGVISYVYPYYGNTINNKNKTTVYKVSNNDHQFDVHVTEKMCLDVETGKSYETTVVVVLDGLSYWGCGNFEHQSHM
ncbi:MAG: hypothetical protein WBN57_13435 [Gammaproteobacteria bacterium]